MNPKSTWNWIIIAVALFAFIFFFERHQRKETSAPQRVLPQIKSSAVTSVQVRPAGQLEIRADRTNSVWMLTRPLAYPAQATSIDALLSALEGLTPMTYISTAELRQKPKFDEEFGFDAPQFSLTLQQGEERTQLLVGGHTAPGDQVFLQVVGAEGVYVVAADSLNLIPHSPDEWRDRVLARLGKDSFDRIVINAAGRSVPLELSRDTGDKLWKVTSPLSARADNKRLVEMLQTLQATRVTRFVTDDPRAELETYGLRPPELELTFAAGTNAVAVLQFGKVSTNDPPEVFVRHVELGAVVTVPAESLAPWRAGVNGFRDHRFLEINREVARVDVRGTNAFSLQFTNGVWMVMGETFPVDIATLGEFLNALSSMQIMQFKDVVTPSERTSYGLDAPVLEISLWSTNGLQTPTNPFVTLAFGKEEENQIYVQRSDEQSAYTVRSEDFYQLPMSKLEFRERRLWNFSENDVAKLVVRQNTKETGLIRNGTNSWSFAEGSHGELQGHAVESVAQYMGTLSATVWRARGDEHRQRFGFDTNTMVLTFELKNGKQHTVEIASTPIPYGAAILDGRTWIFEFPSALYQLVVSYLTFSAANP